MRKAIIIRGSSLDRETRATKIVRTLMENDFDAHLLWWDRGLNIHRSERKEAGAGFSEAVFKFRAPWGILSLLFLPLWWLFILSNLLSREWDIAHAIQVISLPPAILAAKLKNRPVIYDMLDTYEDSILLPQVVRNLCVYINKLLMKSVDAVIIADEEQIIEMNGIPNDDVEAIYDSPLTITTIDKSIQNNDYFTLFFAGSLDSGKYLNLDKLFEALNRLEGVKITIAGYGDLVPYIQDIAKEMPTKVDYIGEISHAEVLQRSTDADLLIMLRDIVLPVNRFICGSKILESMTCGTPIIVNQGSSTANLVRKTNCGIVVDAHNVDEISNAIDLLKKNADICKQLGRNGKIAHLQHYSWDIMGNRLISLYSTILSRY